MAAAEHIETSDGLDVSTVQRIDKGWKCIKEQFLDKAEGISKEEGPGISIFCFLREKTRGNNCEYYYATRGSDGWKALLDLSEHYQRNIERLYDPTNHFLVSVQVPVGERGSNTSGTIRMFHFETREEVNLSEEELLE